MNKYFPKFQLEERNTFKINSVASHFYEIDQICQLESVFKKHNYKDCWILGGGSNVVLPPILDKVVIHPTHKQIEIINETTNHIDIRVGAGYVWHDLVRWTIDQGYFGLENLSLIPGTVGACPIQNIGAYGSEVKDFIINVNFIDLEKCKLETLSNKECNFEYRNSVFKNELKNKVLIWSVDFRLSKNFFPKCQYKDILDWIAKNNLDLENLSALQLSDIIIDIRKKKLPDPKVYGNAGSFFKNPEILHEQKEKLIKDFPQMPVFFQSNKKTYKLSAAWLLDKAGLKNHCLNNVCTYENQPLVLINKFDATKKDVINIANDIVVKVFNKFGVTLEIEVNII